MAFFFTLGHLAIVKRVMYDLCLRLLGLMISGLLVRLGKLSMRYFQWLLLDWPCVSKTLQGYSISLMLACTPELETSFPTEGEHMESILDRTVITVDSLLGHGSVFMGNTVNGI